MDQFEPYYADDTQGVHFGVRFEGQIILAHAGRRILSDGFGVAVEGHGWVAIYLITGSKVTESLPPLRSRTGPKQSSCACRISPEQVRESRA